MHKLLTDQPGATMVLLGNEAIARGAIEAGVAVATTYPGHPVLGNLPEFFSDLPGIRACILNTAPMKKWPWKWLRQRPMPGFAACAS